MPGEVYNAGDVIDKTLFAKGFVPVYSGVPGNLPPGKTIQEYQVGYVKPGGWVGRVDTWISADPVKGRPNIWWAFYPAQNYGQRYYSEHLPGVYDISSLREQGVLSTQEKIEEAENENKPWYEQLGDKALTILKYGIGVGLAVYAVKAAIQSRNKTGA